MKHRQTNHPSRQRLGLFLIIVLLVGSGTSGPSTPSMAAQSPRAESLEALAKAWAPLWVIPMESHDRTAYLTAFDLDGNLDLADNPMTVEQFPTPSVLYWWGARQGDLIFLGYAAYKALSRPEEATRWIGVLLKTEDDNRPPAFLATVLPRNNGRYELGIESNLPMGGILEDLVISNPAVDCDLGCRDQDFVQDERGLHPIVGDWQAVEAYCESARCSQDLMDLRGAQISPSERGDGRPHPNDRRLLPELERPRGDSVVYWYTGVETTTSTPDRSARGLLAHNGEITSYGLRSLGPLLGRLSWTEASSSAIIGSPHLPVWLGRVPAKTQPTLSHPFRPLGFDRRTVPEAWVSAAVEQFFGSP